ncbi:thiamine phosphate synthase [Caproicibacter sp.]|uniref:thiamine phosphate synthase n=1 Tax=Caproicibacter sp. TaxID=2814884 RepID=UPI00398A3683
MRRKIDYTLYLCTDRNLMSTKTLEEAVEQAILGGCTLVQLREKDISSLEFYRMAVGVKKITDRYGVPLIVNDRADIALAVGADGVHAGQSDLPCKNLRTILGQDRIVGISAATVEEAVRAQGDGADYVGVGAMFPTGTKTDARPVSMETLAEIRRAVTIPIVAIGGIGPQNAGRFCGTGVDGLAVVSAILAQPDITSAARELRTIFRRV